MRTLFLSSLGASIVATGCFVVIGDIPEGSGGAQLADAASGGGNAGSGGISGSSGSPSGGASGAGASAGDGGVGGASGNAGSAGAASTGGNGGSVCVNPPCDCDGDGYDKLGCVQDGGTPDDCDDTDPDAFPGQLGWFHEMRNDGAGFDYNCDGQEEREFSEITCGGLSNLLCLQQAVGFHQPAQPCGQPGSYGQCKWQGLGCVNDVTSPAKIVRCH